MGAILDAVEADEALALAQVGLRVGSALAAFQAKVAIGAAHRVAIDSPEREPAEEPQKRTQRADRPAEKPGNPPVGEEEADEDEADDPGLPVLAGLGVDALGRLVHGGQHARGHRPDGQRDRVEQTDLERAVAQLVLIGRLCDARADGREDPRQPRSASALRRGRPARSCQERRSSWE